MESMLKIGICNTMSGSKICQNKMASSFSWHFRIQLLLLLLFYIFFNKKFMTFERSERKVELALGSIQ